MNKEQIRKKLNAQTPEMKKKLLEMIVQELLLRQTKRAKTAISR